MGQSLRYESGGAGSAPARLRDFALCWMFFSLASTGFLEHLTMTTDGALSILMFANSLPVDARVKNYRKVALFRLIWPAPEWQKRTQVLFRKFANRIFNMK